MNVTQLVTTTWDYILLLNFATWHEHVRCVSKHNHKIFVFISFVVSAGSYEEAKATSTLTKKTFLAKGT